MFDALNSSSHTPRLSAAENEQTPLLHCSSNEDAEISSIGPVSYNTESRRLSARTSYKSLLSEMDFAARMDQSPSPPRISLVLENSGSVARDHLASERTFLAYVRTSLTVASAAVALAQLLSYPEKINSRTTESLPPFETFARPLAVVSIILALFVLFVGVSRYFSVQAALTQGKFPVTRLRVGIIALAFGAIISAVFGLVVAER
ncbi:hypothetical protein MVEN_01827000 [Mycena venus]|uniref:DUF202 domain-containing protein n=1 Tax=Mycena venus TaxID=2733690 RepID=A0A8H6XL06_9AGAR|nr:hypothetical protein MVEN_01827000 [Mycena venus]